MSLDREESWLVRRAAGPDEPLESISPFEFELLSPPSPTSKSDDAVSTAFWRPKPVVARRFSESASSTSTSSRAQDYRAFANVSHSSSILPSVVPQRRRRSDVDRYRQEVPAILGIPPKDVKRSVSSGVLDTSKSSPLPRKIRWQKGGLIGAGSFGRVFLGLNVDTGELIAVKQFDLMEKSSSSEQLRDLEAEIELLKGLSHPNIVRYLGMEQEDDVLSIFLEYVPGGSIHTLLQKFGKFHETIVRVYTKQILQGLVYLHTNNIVHRDIKGANILVDTWGVAKLADFGAAKKLDAVRSISGSGSDQDFGSLRGTPFWMAPETIRGSLQNKASDIWGVGCTVLEMVTGDAPWRGLKGEQVSILFKIAESKGGPPIPEDLSPSCKDFLARCFHSDPAERPSAEELSQHAFVAVVSDQPQSSPDVDRTGYIQYRSPLSSGGSPSLRYASDDPVLGVREGGSTLRRGRSTSSHHRPLALQGPSSGPDTPPTAALPSRTPSTPLSSTKNPFLAPISPSKPIVSDAQRPTDVDVQRASSGGGVTFGSLSELSISRSGLESVDSGLPPGLSGYHPELVARFPTSPPNQQEIVGFLNRTVKEQVQTLVSKDMRHSYERIRDTQSADGRTSTRMGDDGSAGSSGERSDRRLRRYSAHDRVDHGRSSESAGQERTGSSGVNHYHRHRREEAPDVGHSERRHRRHSRQDKAVH